MVNATWKKLRIQGLHSVQVWPASNPPVAPPFEELVSRGNLGCMLLRNCAVQDNRSASIHFATRVKFAFKPSAIRSLQHCA